MKNQDNEASNMLGKVEMNFRGLSIDVLPYADMAIILLEQGEALNAGALAKLFRERNGVNILKSENPFRLPFHRVNTLMDRMTCWLQFEYHLRQARDVDVGIFRPVVHIKVLAAPCERTKAMDGKIMPATDVPLLPYPECPLGQCLISISALSKSEIEKLAS